jgi:hypothetical protein
MPLQISYLNFWPEAQNDLWFTKFLKNTFPNEEIKIVGSNADIVFGSVFGDIGTVRNCNAKVKIFFYGENLDRYPPYNDIKLLQSVFNLIVGFKTTNLQSKIFRLPLWVTYYPFYKAADFMQFLEKSRASNKEVSQKKLFATCVARHDRGGQRVSFYDSLSKCGAVSCPSSFKNNCPNVGPLVRDKINFISTSEFNICPENSYAEGYFTEKIFQALEAGTVPIYNAIEPPEKESLNSQCYVFIAEPANTSEVDTKIKHAVENKNDYLNSALFTNQAPYVIQHYYTGFEQQVKQLLGRQTSQKVHGISYASRHFQTRNTVIESSAARLGFFDSFTCLTETDLSESFKEEFKEVYNNSTRGGGYWIWKPHIIYNALKNLKDNDFLVYVDAGCNFCATTEAQIRFRQYLNLVNNHWSGILRFHLGIHLEKDFTNAHTVSYFKEKFQLKESILEEVLDTPQLLSGIIIMKKCDFVMDFFEKCLEITRDDPFMFTDKYTTPPIRHRHDQSILSFLHKIMKGSLVLKDETWFGGLNGNFGSAESKKFPIWATRQRV